MNCLFCHKKLKSRDPANSVFWTYYKCLNCLTSYHYDNSIKEVASYYFCVKGFEIACYPNDFWHTDYKFIFSKNGIVIVKLPFIPANITPTNLLEKAKTMIIFS